MEHLKLEDVDKDGAIREAQEAVAGDTRLSFLGKGAAVGGAAVGGGGLLSAVFATSASASNAVPRSYKGLKFAKGDIGILQFALTLEYLEAAFYNEAMANGKIVDPQQAAFLEITRKDENAHVNFLKGALGKKYGFGSPTFDFGDTTSDPTMFINTSLALESTGVRAYFGQAPNFKDSANLLAAASILTIEARHAGAAAALVGPITSKNLTPVGSFDRGNSAKTTINIVLGTKFITKL